jgi:nucleoside-diphosphate-sugar epimerase
MKALVTGAAGFIGSQLVEQLLVRGQEVVGLDSLSDNYDSQIKQKNLEKALSSKKFTFIKEDMLQADLDSLLSGVDHVFHEAALSNTADSWKNIEEYTRCNIFATAKLLEASKKAKIKKFIYSSSSSVYGSLTLYPFKEAFPVRPISPYGITKLKGEELCGMYYHDEKLPVVVLRYFTVYGPRQRPDMAIYKMIKAALKSEEFTVYGGKQERDFTYISDAVNATIRAAEMGRFGETYNIGTGIETPVSKLLGIVEELTGKKIKIIQKETVRGDMPKTHADITKMTNELEMSQSTALKDGIAKQIEWMKKNI